MKRLSTALLAIGLVASGSAFAQSAYSPSNDGYYGGDDYNRMDRNGDARPGDAYYDYARVIRVDPVLDGRYGQSSNYRGQRCYETTTAGGYERDGYYQNDGYARGGYGRPYGDPAGRSMATIAGGVIGAVLGNQVGGGAGKFAATTVGSMVGGIAGREVYDQTQRDRYAPGGSVRVCEPDPAGNGDYRRAGDIRVNAYDVTYEYNGRRYTRRMDYHPGERVRVRVDVSPQ